MIRRMKLSKDKPPNWWSRTSAPEKMIVAIFLVAIGYVIYRAIAG